MQNTCQRMTGTFNTRFLRDIQAGLERFWSERLLNLKKFLEGEVRATREEDMKVHVDALESELNNAIIDLSGSDFVLGNFDLQALFLESLGRYYSDDVGLWLQDKLTHGKMASFQRMAGLVEPIYTFLEMGMASVDTFHVTGVQNGLQGEVVAEWEAVLGGPHSTGTPIRWRTTRVWKDRVVVAERLDSLP